MENPGLCFRPCDHDHCRWRHALAKKFCRICSKSIGYNLRFIGDPTTEREEYVHLSCLGFEVEMTINPPAQIGRVA